MDLLRDSPMATAMRPMVFLLVALASAGCSSVSVETDYDKGFDFGRLHSFAWMPPPQGDRAPYMENTLFIDRLKRSVDGVLQGKGFTLAEGPDPDFQIAFRAGVEEKTRVTDWGYSTSYYGRRSGYGVQRDISVQQYNEGTLILDLVDPKTRSLVWRGIATTVLGGSHALDEAEVREIVEQLLAEFPPGGSKGI